MLNEPDLIAQLEQHGFEIVDLESLPFKKQAELFMSATIIISPHGAGRANLVFCNPGSELIEILTSDYLNDYCKMAANNAGVKYRCMIFPSINKSYDYYVDIPAIMNEIAS